MTPKMKWYVWVEKIASCFYVFEFCKFFGKEGGPSKGNQ